MDVQCRVVRVRLLVIPPHAYGMIPTCPPWPFSDACCAGGRFSAAALANATWFVFFRHINCSGDIFATYHFSSNVILCIPNRYALKAFLSPRTAAKVCVCVCAAAEPYAYYMHSDNLYRAAYSTAIVEPSRVYPHHHPLGLSTGQVCDQEAVGGICGPQLPCRVIGRH